MKSAEYWIENLRLEAHPEGGYFGETYRCDEHIMRDHLPERYQGNRTFSTAIYYLLKGDQFSAFHRLRSDEIWHFYAGPPLSVYSIDEGGVLRTSKLGSNPDLNEAFQITIPQSRWFCARCNDPDGYSLVGATVAPGFDFEDFEIAKRSDLLRQFREHREIIESLTRE